VNVEAKEAEMEMEILQISVLFYELDLCMELAF